MRPRFVAFALSVALLLLAGGAHAERRRVAIVNGTELVERQITIALSAWDLDVRRVDWTSLGNGMPDAATEARRVAETHQVDAVVWFSDSQSGSALWIYDAGAGQVVSRPIQVPARGDTANAASIALTVKTLLRSTGAAPASERIGAGAEPPVGPWGVFRGEVDGGARFFAASATVSELRGGLTLLWWPAFLRQYAALAVGFAYGPGFTVTADDFTGHFVDLSISPALRARIPLGARFALEPALGMTAHLAHLDGASALARARVETDRWDADAAAEASLTAYYTIGGPVGVGVRGVVSHLLRYQHYLVQGTPVLQIAPWNAGASLVLGVRLN